MVDCIIRAKVVPLIPGEIVPHISYCLADILADTTPQNSGKRGIVSSLNFDSKIWISSEYNYDPYKTLPKIFEDFSREELDDAFSGLEDVADGGAAMMAYAKLQFFNTNQGQRDAIRQALLKYCELDTLAMVMLWEFWTEMVNL